MRAARYVVVLALVVGLVATNANLSAAENGWSVVAGSVGATSGSIYAVSCPSPSSCFALGATQTQNVIDHWNGVSWSQSLSARPGGIYGDMPTGVSCVAASSCVAVGYSGDAGQRTSFVERWSGATWSKETNPRPGVENSLLGVSCAAVASCVAVGFTGDASAADSTLIERWNGVAWSVDPSPTSGVDGDLLDSVSCAAVSSCIAVGVAAIGTDAAGPLIERWDGVSWSVDTSITQDSSYSLGSVSCPAADNCVAVGWQLVPTTPFPTAQPLTEFWDGSTWSIVPAGVGGPEGELVSVTCSSTSSCVAVGTAFGTDHTSLIERWDGAGWAVETGATLAEPAGLNSASCATASVCVAVGTSGPHVLIETDGITAASVPSAPSAPQATPHAGHVAVVRWSMPSANGAPITSYTATASPGGKTVNVSAPHTTATFDGLPENVSFRFRVRATNAAGSGPWSAWSNSLSFVTIHPLFRAGYWMLGADGHVYAFGVGAFGNAPGPVVAIAPRRDGTGYWVTDALGDVSHFGAAGDHGGRPPLNAGELVSTISVTPSGNGYWLFTNRGRAFGYGDAHLYGDMSGTPLNGPIIASVATATGHGYYMVGSDGGVFSFGDARFHGSTGNLRLNQPVVGISPTPDNRGYWLVASDGGVFAFDAPFRGSMGGRYLNKSVNGLVAYGNGYLMVASDGGIFDFSDVAFAGSLADTPPAAPIVGVAAFTSR
jgi:hypothetical protein